jgi:hypothetical protein
MNHPTKNTGNAGNPTKVAAFKAEKQRRNSEAYGIESKVGKPKERAKTGISENTKK